MVLFFLPNNSSKKDAGRDTEVLFLYKHFHMVKFEKNVLHFDKAELPCRIDSMLRPPILALTVLNVTN